MRKEAGKHGTRTAEARAFARDRRTELRFWNHQMRGELDAVRFEIWRALMGRAGRTGGTAGYLPQRPPHPNPLTYRWTPGSTNTIETSYSYDSQGNLTTVDYPVTTNIVFTYDGNDRVITMVDAVGSTTYSYTGFGAVASEDGPWDNDTVSYAYNNDRLRQSTTLLQPNSTAWFLSYAYDSAHRLTNVTSAAGAFGYKYSPAPGAQASQGRARARVDAESVHDED